MEKIWLKSYPPGVPHDINPEQYRSLPHMLEESFQKNASSPFAVCMESWMTYGELDQLSAALGAWLQDKGLEPDARVAIMLPNIPQFPVPRWPLKVPHLWPVKLLHPDHRKLIC